MKIDVLSKNVSSLDSDAWLIKVNESDYYIVSAIDNKYAKETAIFKSSVDGDVLDWGSIITLSHECDHEKAIDMLCDLKKRWEW